MEIFLTVFTLIGAFSSETLFVGKAGDQIRVSASVSQGRFIVVVEDPNCGKPEKHICLFDGGSEELADDSFVSTAFPSVSADSSGNIYVVWSDAREIEPTSGQRTWDIYLRKKVGGVWQPSERINPKTSTDACGQQGDQINPDVYVSTSGLYIVWQTIERDGRSFVCYVRSPDFGRTWEPNRKLFEGYNPAIAVSGNKVFIVYSDINGNIHFASSDDGGATFSVRTNPVVSVYARLPDLSSPDIAVSPSGNLILVWQDKPPKPGKPDDIDIFISISRDGGQTWGTPQQLELDGDQINPSVVFLGGVFIFFSHKVDNLRGFDIYKVESRGNLILSAGGNNPSGTLSVPSGTTSVVLAQLKFEASSELSEAEVKTINVRAFGTMNDAQHVSQIRVWWDRDGNGVISSPDVLLGSGKFSSDDGTLSLQAGFSVITPNPEYVIITADFSKPIPRDSTFSIQVEPSGIVAVLPGTSNAVDVLGSAVSGRTIRISNNFPTARISSSHSSVLEGSGTRVRLDASSSSDPDSDTLSFSWRQVGGTPVSLSTSHAIAEFTAPESVTRNDSLVFEVTVSDGFGGVSTAQVSITVIDTLNEPPSAVAKVNIGGNRFGGPVYVNEGDVVVLDASESSDPNGDALFYFWSQFSGNPVEIVNPTRVTAYFIAPDVVGVDQIILTFNLGVRDSKGAFSSDSIQVIVRNTKNDPPSARFIATPSKGTAPLDVFFDASPSFDPDGNITIYRWSFGDGSEISTSNPTISHRFENPGEYRVTLTVYDNAGEQATYSDFITALSEFPQISVFAGGITSDVPFGVDEDIIYIRVSNISGENIVINNMSFTISGIPDATFYLMLDSDGDRKGDSVIFSFSLSATSQTFLVPVGVVVNGGSTLNFTLKVRASPVQNLPVEYTVSFDGISSRGAITGVEPRLMGMTLPFKFSFSVRKPALVFSSNLTQVVVSGSTASFSISVDAKGDSFTIKSLAIEYNPTVIYSVVLFSDNNGNGVFDSGEEVLANLTSGEQNANLSFSISKGGRRYIGFYIYTVRATSPPLHSATTISDSGEFPPEKGEGFLIPLFSSLSSLFLIVFLLTFTPLSFHLLNAKAKLDKRTYFVSSLIHRFIVLVTLLSLFVSHFTLSCANKAGSKGGTQQVETGQGSSGVGSGESEGGGASGGQQGGGQQGGGGAVGGNTTIFSVKGVSATSGNSSEFSVIGLPLKITIVY